MPMIYIFEYDGKTNRPPSIKSPKDGVYKQKIQAPTLGEAINILYEKKINLEKLDFSYPDLKNATLETWRQIDTLKPQGMEFLECNFTNQNIRDKSLYGTMFKKCNLDNVDMSSCLAINVVFDESILINVDFTKALFCDPSFQMNNIHEYKLEQCYVENSF